MCLSAFFLSSLKVYPLNVQVRKLAIFCTPLLEDNFYSEHRKGKRSNYYFLTFYYMLYCAFTNS
jgi:hypothetical protein